MKIKFEDVKNDETIRVYIEKADRTLMGMGFTEHSFPHVTHVASVAGKILKELEYSKHDIEIARIAGYMHDIGNVVNRHDHAQTGALMAMRILDHMGMKAEDIAAVITAIGNHDEPNAYPVDAVTAAIIIADKTDVRQTRVRNKDSATFDKHDRVNFAVKHGEGERPRHPGVAEARQICLLGDGLFRDFSRAHDPLPQSCRTARL